MPRTPQDVTEKELELLQVLWDEGSSTIRQLRDRLYPGGGTPEYGTVQKLLERLEEKKCVRCERSVPAHVFHAAIEREELIGRRLQKLAEQLCDGSLTPLLTHLVRTRRLTPEERAELRALIEAEDTSSKKKKR
jgi:predicted transcriptional regulator